MRVAALVFSVAVLPSGALPAQQVSMLSPEVREYVSVDARVVALTHVQVIDGTGGPVATDQTVVIANGRIQAVGSAATVRVPAGAEVHDLAGHTVIPGLVGLHNHTGFTTRQRVVQLQYSAPRLYLATGVTTIRTTGSIEPYTEFNMKRAIQEGEAPGPRMHLAGPHVTGAESSIMVGPRVAWNMTRVDTPEQARRMVAYWGEEGATWIKAYTSISRENLAAVIDEAHKHGMKVTAHLCSVTFREAVALGIDNLDHSLSANTDYHPNKELDVCPADRRAGQIDLDLTGEAVQATFRDMVANNVAMTSTVVVSEGFVPNRPPLEQRVLDAMAPAVRTEVLAERAEIAERADPDLVKLFKKAQQYDVAFVKAGGLLAAGSDPTGGGTLPGFGDQRNYELFLEAGFTPVQAVQILTANGAKVLGELDQLGTVEAGKLADLVVINGDIVANPAAIRNVTIVFKDGVGYDSAKLLESVRGVVGVQ